MNIITFMDFFPLWGIFLVSTIIIVVSIESGFQIGKMAQAQGQTAKTSAVVGAALGLLAFMLAFTFGTAANSYNKRKDLVVEEANAIGTAFLRTELMPERYHASMADLLLEYVGIRLEGGQGVGELNQSELDRVDVLISRSEEIQRELWRMGAEIAAENPTAISSLFLQSLNSLIDVHQERVAVSIYHRMPPIFWVALYGLAIMAMLVAGYDAGLSSKRRSMTSLLTVTFAFSAMLLLVVALDRPYEVLSRVPQAPLMEVQGDIQATMALRAAL